MSGQLEGLRLTLGGRYTIERELGSGGMGTVFQAYDAARREKVALKTLRRTDAANIYRFKKEFRALADIAHGNLVHLHELVAEGDTWFFTMELIQGQDLLRHVRPGYERASSRAAVSDDGLPVEESLAGFDQRARAGPCIGRLDLERLRGALRQLIAGVAALHGAMIVHRDLKPANVLVTREGRVVILDFGIAAEVRPSLSMETTDGSISGTIEYMAPEECAGQRSTPASDWYSVGALLYEALTGRLPYSGAAVQVLRRKLESDPPPPDTLVTDLPPDLVTLCLALMSRSPGDRPSDEDLRGRLRLAGSAAIVDERGRLVEGVPLVGRAAHLEQLSDAFAAARRGRPVSVCVVGPSGIGKTTLVRHFTDDLAAGRRAVVLAGRCFVRETVPYKALDGVIDMLSRLLRARPDDSVEEGLPSDISALARVFPVLRRVVAIDRLSSVAPQISDARELRRRAFGALDELLRTIAQRCPVVLLIDDLQWADRDSADLLRDMLEAGAPGHLLFVLSFRSEDVAGAPLLRELVAQAHTDARRMLEIGPLETADAVEYALRMLGASLPDAEARARMLAQESAGNPFLLDQMVRATLEAERGVRGTSVGLTRMLAGRVAQMPPGARELLEVLALAGEPIAAGLAFRAAGLVGDERPLLTGLRLAHLVRESATAERVDIYHDRIREVMVHDLEAARARSIHHRLAEGLERAGDARLEALYAHWLGAGDTRRAAEFAAKAAGEAQATLALERAALFYRRAVDLCVEPGPQRAAWLIGLGDALASAGRGEEAARAYLEARPMLDEQAGLEAERRAGAQYLLSGRIEDGLQVMGRVLARLKLPPLATSPGRALLALLLRRLRIALRGLGYVERNADTIPPATLARIDACSAVAEGLGMVDAIQAQAFQALHLRLALDAGEPLRVGRALAVEAGLAASTGADERAARAVREAERLAIRPEARATLGLCRVMLGVGATHRGRFEDAERLLIEGEAILAEHQSVSSWALNVGRMYRVGGIIDQGKIRELCRLTQLFLDDALDRGNRLAAIIFRSQWSILRWLCVDDLEGARATVADATRQCPRGIFAVPHLYCLVAQVLVDLYAGAAEDAYLRIESAWPALERSKLLRVPWGAATCLRMRAAAAIAAAQVARDREPLLSIAERHVRRLRRQKYSPVSTVAWPLMLEAAIAVTRGDRAKALDGISRAADRFQEHRSAFYCAVAKRQKGRLLGGDEGRALVAQADAWMAGEGIVNSARLTAAFVPGIP